MMGTDRKEPSVFVGEFLVLEEKKNSRSQSRGEKGGGRRSHEEEKGGECSNIYPPGGDNPCRGKKKKESSNPAAGKKKKKEKKKKLRLIVLVPLGWGSRGPAGQGGQPRLRTVGDRRTKASPKRCGRATGKKEKKEKRCTPLHEALKKKKEFLKASARWRFLQLGERGTRRGLV